MTERRVALHRMLRLAPASAGRGLRLLVPWLAGALAGCIVVPRTTTTYDADCQVVSKRVELEATQVASLVGCRGSVECGGLLVTAGVVAAASVVVSGSIAIVGNVAYWLEKQGQCNRPG